VTVRPFTLIFTDDRVKKTNKTYDERPKKKRLRKIADSDSESIYNNNANEAIDEVSDSA
jgi:hypothetical protein